MLFQDWIAMGREHGFCSLPTCSTHDILPMSEEENTEWDKGNDPCCVVVRVYQTREEYEEVETPAPDLSGS
jgi:hypothetical protein